MQKIDLEATFEDTTVSTQEGLHKANEVQVFLRHFARECRIKGTQDNRRRDAWNSRNKDGSRTGQKGGIIKHFSTARASSTKNLSTARQSFNRQTVLTSTAMKVNTVKPIVNRVRPANVFHKTHSPSSRPFKKTTILRTYFSKQKGNTAKVNAVSTVGGKKETAVKPSAGCNWRSQRYNWHNVSKYNGGSNLRNLDVPGTLLETRPTLLNFKTLMVALLLLEVVKVISLVKGFCKENKSAQDCFVLPIWPSYSSTITPDLKTDEKREDPREEERVFMDELERLKRQEKEANEEAEALREKQFEQETQETCYPKRAAKTSRLNIFRYNRESLDHSRFFLMGRKLLAHNKVGLSKKRMKEDRIALSSRKARIVLRVLGKKKVSTMKAVFAPEAMIEQKDLFSLCLIHVLIGYRRGTIDKTLFIKKDKHDIILVQVYVDDIIFGSTKKSWCDEFEALMKKIQKKFDFAKCKENLLVQQLETLKPLVKDEEARDVDVHLYSHSANTPKSSHLDVVKRIFRNLKEPKLGSLYPMIDSLSMAMQKRQTIWLLLLQRQNNVATANSCSGQNPVYHSKTKHIALRHHFIRDAYEKKLIQVLKIHTDDNVADLLTKAFDVTLISLLTTISLSSTMAVLDSCPKHNMVAYLEKSKGNAEFHEIIDFLKRSSIHHALTVSPVVSTTFVEQFWTSAKSKTINNVRHITAKVAGKSVSISEASIRSDLLFDDADGIDSLPNQAIFDAIQLMGYEGDLTVLTFNKALFSPQWRFLFHTINHCLSSKSTSWDQIPTNIATAVICLTSNQKYNFSKLIFDGMLRHLDAKKKFVMYPHFISIFLGKQLDNVSVPLDHFPVNTLTSKVFSFMVKKGKHFSGKVTPLFATMLVQPTQDEGASSERPSEAQPTPSPAPTSEVPYEPQTDSSLTQTSEVPIEHQPNPSPRPSPTTTIPDSIPETSGENLGGHSSSDKSLSGNEGDMTLQSVYDVCLSLCTQVSDQAKEIQALKAQITKLKKQAKPVIKHHKAYLKSVSLKKRFPRKSFSKKHRVHKESVSKQGKRSLLKVNQSVLRDPLFDEIPEDTVDHMETENAQNEGRTREMVDEDKKIDENILSTEDVLSTDKDGETQNEGTEGRMRSQANAVSRGKGERCRVRRVLKKETVGPKAFFYKITSHITSLFQRLIQKKRKKKIEEEA
ncbi:hypothetical protein Tco_1327660 [Tanacetum coccineum]